MLLTASSISNARLPRRITARALLLTLTGAVAVACAFAAQHQSDLGDVPAWVVMASLVAIVGAAIALPDPLQEAADTVKEEAESWRMVVLGSAALLVPAIGAFVVWSGEPFSTMQQFVNQQSSYAALVWLGGIVAGLVVLWLERDYHSRGAAKAERWARWPWLAAELAALLMILDVAAGLRLWHLGVLPEGIWFDEADFANSAQRLFDLPFQPFGPGNVGHNPSLYFYVEAVMLKLAGTSMAGVRLSSVLFGLIAVIAVYLLGRRVGGAPLGLIAAAFLGMGQWAVDFSRFGMSNIAAPAMIGLGFAALAVAMARPRAFWFALSGITLGLSLLTYAGGFIAGGGVAVVLVTLRLLFDPAFRRTAWPACLLLPLGIAVGAAPWLTALKLDSDYTLARERTVSLLSEYSGWSHRVTALLSNLKAHLLMFTVAGDTNGRHNLPGAPMLDTVTGAGFLLGLGMCLRRLNRWFYALLVLWLGASMLGGILSLDFEAPQGARTVGAVAPIALIAALPLAALAKGIWTALVQRIGTRSTAGGEAIGGTYALSHAKAALAIATTTALVCVPLGVALSSNIDGYFVQHANDSASWSEMDGLQAVMGRAASSLIKQGYEVRVSPSLAGDPALEWAAGNVPIGAYDPNVPVALPVPPGGLALIIPSSEGDVLGLVHRTYPTAQTIALTPSYYKHDVQATTILLHAQDVERNIGVTVTFGTGASTSSQAHVQAAALWPPGSGHATAVTLRGTLAIGSTDAWQIVALRIVGIKHAWISVDGTVWDDAVQGTRPMRLGAGNHALLVEGRGPAGRSISLQWARGLQAAGNAGWAPIPAINLMSPSVPTGGLLGLYYPGPTIEGAPVLERVDQTVDTYYQTPPPNTQFPFSARWLGTLNAATGGLYQFALDSTGPSRLYIDGALVVAGGPGASATTATATLRPGLHLIRVDYNATGSYLHCYLTWAPPGQSALSALPPSATQPAHG